jgi:hypothetical protein
MNNFYIFNHIYREKEIDKTITIIFGKDNTFHLSLKVELDSFFQYHLLPDYFLVLSTTFAESAMRQIFIDDFDKTFGGIPLYRKSILKEDITIASFNIKGQLDVVEAGKLKKVTLNLLDSIKRNGLQQLFQKRGGLVVSVDTHHYVFPSGKHCDRFLRTGNILIHSSEIYFIAFCLLKKFDENIHTDIYCDTSSINTIAFALIELKNRFLQNKLQVNVSSFNSYSGLYHNDYNYKPKDLLLISASTSGNIIGYITKNHPLINEENIVVLYFLSNDSEQNSISLRLLCNLTFEKKTNPSGVLPYLTYSQKDCKHCETGSHAVEVSGDVFLLEKPSINSRMLKIDDPEKHLSSFVEEFRTQKNEHGTTSATILKCNYSDKNASAQNHEIYIDYNKILEGFADGFFIKYKSKLDDYITQYVPANTEYMIHVDEDSSKALATYIINDISKKYKEDSIPKLISIDDLDTLTNGLKTAVIVCSCVSYGKKLLYVARALRNLNQIRLVYFIGLTRLKSKESLSFLKSNLVQGKYASETSTFVSIENVFSHRDISKTAWDKELENISKLLSFSDQQQFQNFELTLKYLKERQDKINSSNNTSIRGLSDDLFFDSHLIVEDSHRLTIRKNFAFFDFEKYHGVVSQSDIYFTISNIINSKRNSKDNKRSLEQSPFVRNLISPLNFNRFNDGIIQASILRLAYHTELSYIVDEELSFEMFSILETMIKYSTNHQAEALTEFLYAIAFGKLTLKRGHFDKLLLLLDGNLVGDTLLSLLREYIKIKTVEEVYFDKKKTLEENPAF